MTQSKTQNNDRSVKWTITDRPDIGAYFCPYIPMPSNTPPWEVLLDTLHVNHTLDISKHKTPQDHIMDAIAVMQERYPGEYTIEETYCTIRMKFAYKMVFNSKEDKALFVLKYAGE